MKISYALGLIAATSLALTLGVHAQTTAKPSTPQASKPVPQKTFETAQQAGDALVAAAQAFDVAALESIFGADGRDLFVSSDTVQDKNRATAFAAGAKERHKVTRRSGEREPRVPVGRQRRLAVPRADRPARQDVGVRRAARDATRSSTAASAATNSTPSSSAAGYVEAQHEYALTRHAGSSVNQYAQRIISTPGKQDGLAWQNADGTWGGPIGEAVARAITEGYSDKAEPYNGYFFKVLTGQGPAAPLGEMDFVIKGVMIGGFALVAAPAEYGVTGVKTFMVSHDGVVYEKDLGTGTLAAFKAMTRFNPDKTWTPVD